MTGRHPGPVQDPTWLVRTGHRVWPARADALTLIRHEVRRWLGPLEMMPEADLVLAVNEAASNVIDHA